jgi:hypothetical protein
MPSFKRAATSGSVWYWWLNALGCVSFYGLEDAPDGLLVWGQVARGHVQVACLNSITSDNGLKTRQGCEALVFLRAIVDS